MADATANLDRPGISAHKLLLWAIFNPGFQLISLYRAYHWLYRRSWVGKIASMLLSNLAIYLFSCHIKRDAKIGVACRLPHPIGIVIGDGAVVEDNVSIYQHVSIGRTTHKESDYGMICSGATIYSGAVIAGNVRVGRHAIIGANSVVTHDVPDNATAVGVPARLIKTTADNRNRGAR